LKNTKVLGRKNLPVHRGSTSHVGRISELGRRFLNSMEEQGKREGKAERRQSGKEVLKGLFPLSLPSLLPLSSLYLP
jgi:hypothetical protein